MQFRLRTPFIVLAVGPVALAGPWYQFRLRNLLLVITLLCVVPGGFIAHQRNQARRQSATLKAIEELNGIVRFKEESPSRPVAMQWLLGDDKYSRVNAVGDET